MLTIKSIDFRACDKKRWNEDLVYYEGATIHNTAQHALVSSILSKNKYGCIYFLEIRRSQKVVGKALVLLQPIIALYSNNIIKRGLKVISPLFKSISWFQAPLISDPEVEGVLEAFLNWIDGLAKANQSFCVEIAVPPFYSQNNSNRIDGIYKRKGYSGSNRATVVLNLEKFEDVDACWNNIKHEARNKVNKALRDGISIIEDTDFKFLGEFIKLQKNSDYANLPFYRDEKLFKNITGAYNAQSEMCKLFVACKDGKVLSGQVLFIFNKIIILEGVVISEACRKYNWYANDLMQWHLISWAKKNNCKLIDWGGYALSPSKKEEGINQFKLKWGGEIYKFNAYSKVFIPWKYKFYLILKRIKKFNS